VCYVNQSSDSVLNLKQSQFHLDICGVAMAKCRLRLPAKISCRLDWRVGTLCPQQGKIAVNELSWRLEV
jgi:hypothetical protein